MITAIKKRFLIAVLAVMSVLMAFSGVCVLANANEQAEPQTALEQITFTMVDGASVRLDGRNGMRFAGQMSVLDYQKIEGAYKTLEYGVFIMPNFYAEDIGELNYENTFGGAKYVWGDQYDSPVVGEGADAKYRIIHMESLAVEKTINSENCYLVRGSVHDILPQNIATEYTACAYIKATPAEGEVEYKFATAMTTTRSMLEVSFRALNTGDYDDTDNSDIVAKKAILESYKTSYVEYLGYEPKFSYTVNYVVDGVAEPVKTEKVENVAMNTPVSITPTAPEGYALDTANEKNVLAGHVYVDNNVVLTVMVIERKNEVITGTLNNGELYYFEKETADDNYSIVLPKALDEEVVEVKIGNTIVEATYDNVAKTLSIASAQLNEVATGDTTLTINTPLSTYTASVTVADVVLRTAQDIMDKVSDTRVEGYYILGNDIDGVVDYASNYNACWLVGTLDGKGYAIKNLAMNSSARGFFDQIRPTGVLKNIAFINMTHKMAETAMIVNEHRGTIDNVFVSGVNAGRGALVNTNYATAKVTNVISVISGKTTSALVNSVIYSNAEGAVVDNYYSVSNYTGGLVPGKYDNSFSLVAELFDKFNGTLPTALQNSFWKIDVDGNICFGDEIVVEKVNLIKGTKNGNELFFFGKDITNPTGYVNDYVEDGYYKVTMPETFTATAITALSIGAKTITDYSFASGVLKVATSEVSSVANGVLEVCITADEEKYQGKATVANLVLKTEQDLLLLTTLSNKSSDLIVLDGDITWTKTYEYERAQHLYATLDGKGYAIKDMVLGKAGGSSMTGLFSTFQGGWVKNLAMLNVSFGTAVWRGGVLAGEVNSVNTDNVFISIAKYVGVNGLVHTFAGGTSRINNTIVYYPSMTTTGTAGSFSADYGNSINVVVTNSFAVTTNGLIISTENTANTNVNYSEMNNLACADYDALKTASNSFANFSSIYWSVDASGNLCFGDEIAISAS